MTSLNTKSGSTQPVMPLLLPSDDASHTDTLVEEVTRSFGLGRDRIENILPSTAFQQDVIDCAGNNKQRSIGHVAYEISNDIDISNLAAAWKDTIDRTPALRTCAFTSSSGDSYQVVLKDSFVFSWMFCTSVDQKDAVVQDEAAAAASGPRCNRFVLLEDPIGKKKLLVWTFSHALVDNTFQERILGRVLKAYKHVHDELSNRPYTPESSDPEDDGLPLTPTDGSKTPETGGIHPAVQFWEEYLSDLNASAFPHLTSPLAVPYPNARAEQHICFTASAQSTWPSIAVCRTALAILLSRYTHSPEALFGVVTEQQQLLANGPTRTVVPFRVHCTSDQSLSDIISAVNANDDATRQFADVGLRNIASTGDDGSAACGFQTVLLVTDGETGQTSSCELHQKTGESELFMPCTNRALLLHCQMIRDGVSIVARYDRSLIDSQQIARLLRQLGHLIQRLRDSPDKLPSAGEVDILTPEDQAEIQSWNSHPIPSQNTLIHKEMLKTASLSPSKAAVCAWDGEWTYSELDNITSRLAALIKFSTPDQEHPEDVPGLQTLVLVGEQMSPSVNAIWAPRVQLLDGYGQSESSSICFVGNISSSGADPNNIGRSVGAHSWIIDPSDPNRLVPIGAIGELVIESPGIARDYIIPPPTEKSPFFSTQLPDDMSIVVEAVKTSDSPTSTVLVAFLIVSKGTEAAGDGTILDLAATKDMSAKLEQVLPRHSIPSCYISMQHIPRTATGKVDRRKLRSIGRDILAQQIQGTSSRPSQLSSPTTSSRSKLEEVWCQCLGLESGAANIGSTFFELGGHSITAIKMVNMARSAGIELKVSDIYQNPTLAGLEAIVNGLESEAVASKAYTRFDIEFHLFQEADGLKGSCNFATDLFKPETVENVVSVFFQILRNGLEKPHVPISVLPLTDGIEELRRLDLLRIKKVQYPRDASLVDIFRTQVAAYPDSLAVVDSSSRLTYAELDRQSDLLSTWLRRRGMPAETLVGVLAPRSCEAIVAIIGILKANLAYLPFDVKSPSARLTDILSGLPGPTIVLLGSDVPVPELEVPDLEFVRVADAVEYCDTNGLNGYAHIDTLNPTATSLAYVLFTSGSTGRPKGVMVEHRVIVRLMRSNIIPDFPTQPRSAHMFNIAFDGATYEIFFTLLNGGKLVCIDYMTTLDVKALQEVFIKEQINAACMAPALLKLYLTDARDALRGLDFLMAAGDRFDGQDAIDAQSLVRGQCYNGYGPTENGIMSTRYPIAPGDSFINGVPIGRAVNNSGAYVTDLNQKLVGVGVMGELVVTGDGLARGYFDPALNKNRFIHIEVDGQRVRAYRTGDRVRYRVGDGLIEFFGRMDTQFKIRGNRIESAEVEAAMLSHSSVRDAAVVVQKDDGEKADLVGFVVIDHDHSMEVPVHTIEKGTWVDFGASRMDRNSLLHFLRRSKSSEAVAISNIPFAKTDFERQIFESLEAEEESKLDGTAWISAIRSVAESRASLSVPDLYQLAQESGFRLEVSAARQWSQSGALDAVFHHFPLPSDTRRTLIKFPTDNHLRSSATLANRPLQGLQRRRAALQVRERLQSLLPSYMIPSSIVVLDQMPLNPNGKVDRKELARQARIVPKNQAAPPAQAVPISDIEAILCDEATATFGMKVEISDDFFKLGGHSLLATKLVSRVEQRFNVRVTVKDVFDNPVFAHLAVVIREGLASRTTLTNCQDKQGWSARVAPRTETEIILCDEASKLLGIEVGITDNFFDLGGHSMMATKLAMRLGRRLDTTIVVKDIFDYPVLFQLSKKLESAGSETDRDDAPPDDYNPFELLSLEDPQDFIQREICSQLSVSFESIQDTYQSTQMQKSFLFSPGTGSPRPLTPFYIDFPVDSDPVTLVNACHSLVQHIDMFRTVFVLASDQLYQVVLKHLDVPIETIVTNQNVNTATNDFLDEHAQDPIRLGESLIRIAILKQSSSVRVLLRLSHALYDGLSLEPIVRNLHILFNGMSLLPPTQFRRYMEYTANSQEKGFEFWRDVIGDSPMTALSDTSNVACRREVAPSKALHLSKIVSVPSQAIRSSIATQATVFNSACALVLSKESGSSDVVFGRIVSGRQGLPVNCQDIIGPCTNAVPVRAHIGTDENHHQMLRDMQDQYLRSLPFETLGFEEIKRNCTDWSEATANFACCVTYHNFEYHPESEVEQQRVEMGVLSKHVELRKDEPLYDLAIAGEVEPDGMSLKVTIIARAHLFEEERVQYFLEEVCNTFQTLNDSL
ncbi:Polyketide synthase, phosphopantetheine-binding domain [Fusarium oxysporum f. sp. vasinfectum]|nr:Polyketide synthase, phosphopantetheine-binding domain [Fusarium oxysporum f. sp. vasinfectum]